MSRSPRHPAELRERVVQMVFEHRDRHSSQWATIAITLDTYSHAVPAMQEEEAERIAGLVFAER